VGRALKHDVPGPDRRVAVGDVREKGFAALFPELPAALPLVIELGFGRGEFLLALAARAPRQAHVGVEVSHKRVLKQARRLALLPLENVRLVCAPAELVVHELLPPGSVAEFWVNFPDPWPKKRHWKRRLLQAPLVAALAERLTPGGVLHVATDHAEYAEQIAAVLSGEPRLENAFAPSAFVREVPGRMSTAYELEWRAEGRPLHFFDYRRREGPR
jgi:tRNA (guanine-N7-)-methyltransferase